MTNVFKECTSEYAKQRIKTLDGDMKKACCKDTDTGMSPSSKSAKKLVAFASNRLQKEIFGWE